MHLKSWITAKLKKTSRLQEFAATAALAGLLMAPALPAAANDSEAGLKAGGLVLLQNNTISMESEDLYISPEQVRIKYTFASKSESDQSILVAFPLPDLDMRSFIEGGIALREFEKQNFVDFSVKVDGQPIEPKVQHRAIMGGIDITSTLKSLNVPFLPPGQKLTQYLKGLGAQERVELDQYGAVQWNDPNDPVALWTLKTTFYWRQTFPSRSTVTVEHAYKPVTGGFIMIEDQLRPRKPGIWGEEDARSAAEGSAEWPYSKYCMDDGFRRAALKRGKTKEGGWAATGSEIDYILTTGNNWAGPIKNFRLVVDKLKPGNLVSFCAKGVRKIAPTQFEWVQKDFYPQRDLKILVMQFWGDN